MSRRYQHVYLAQDRANHLIKIGCTANIPRRMAELNRQTARGVNLLTTIRSGGFVIEREMHDAFAESRAHGEWFHPSYDLGLFIQLWAERRSHAPDEPLEIDYLLSEVGHVMYRVGLHLCSISEAMQGVECAA